MARQRSDLSLALIVSAIVHVALVGAALIPWPWARELKVGAVVPINIVSSIPANPRPAIAGPEPQTAQTETPEPDAPPVAEPEAPQPAPTAAPAPTPRPTPAPRPAPTPTPKPAPPKKAEPAPRPATPKKDNSLDLDALADSLKGAKSSAPRGPNRAETAREARNSTGAAASAAAMSGLTDELQRRWNPNCEVEAARAVRVRVTFRLGSDGRVVGDVRAGGQESSSDPVVRAAAERAIRAVYASAPFTTLPREFYGDLIAVNFNAAQACAAN